MAFLSINFDNDSAVSIFNEEDDNWINSLDRNEGESEMVWLNRHCESLDKLSMMFNNMPHETHMTHVSQMSHASHVSQMTPMSHVSQMTHASQMTHVSQMANLSLMIPMSHLSHIDPISPLTPMSPSTINTYIIDDTSSVKSSHIKHQTPMSNISSKNDCDIPDELGGSFEADYFDRHNRNLNSLFRKID